MSGGCVEGAVVTEALDVLATGAERLVSFGYSDDDAFAVGLTCGGTVHLFIEPLDWMADLQRRAVRDHRPAVLVTVVDGPGAGDKLLLVEGEQPAGQLADADLHRVVLRDAEAALAAGARRRCAATAPAARPTRTPSPCSSRRSPRRRGCSSSAPSTSRPPSCGWPRCSASTSPCATPARCSPRKARFPLADEVVVDWPHRHLEEVGASLGPRDAVCVLTHDAKFDVPAIVAALGTKVGYLGAMGSRRTTEQRAERLRAEGVTDEQLARLLAPIGLDLGARTPEETAVAICAEIIAQRTGRAAPRLSAGDGPIH